MSSVCPRKRVAMSSSVNQHRGDVMAKITDEGHCCTFREFTPTDIGFQHCFEGMRANKLQTGTPKCAPLTWDARAGGV
jgi:hypothetical protein